MKTIQPGTLQVPAAGTLALAKAKIISLLNLILPVTCQAKSSRDAFTLAAIFFLCITLLFYPAIVAVVYCIVKAGLHKTDTYNETPNFNNK